MKNILILFGGVSSEHEVSLVSASAVLENIDRSKYNITAVGITKSGEWYLHEGEIEEIRNGSWESRASKKVLFDPSRPSCFKIEGEDCVTTLTVDAVFPVMHGAFGEDGTLQGMLELAGVSVVGCPSASAAVCMDKTFTKRVLMAEGIRQAEAALAELYEYRKDPSGVLDKAEAVCGTYPIFVKPARAGSSVGITKASNRDELKMAFDLAFECDTKLLAEKFIKGREIETAVLGFPNGDITVSVCGEIDPGSDFYDYDTKYKADTAKYYIPARLDNDVSEHVRETAGKIFRALDCRGLSRVDFFVTDDGDVIFNEINTIPGFTPISMYPKLMEHAGYSFAQIIDAVLTEAMERQYK